MQEIANAVRGIYLECQPLDADPMLDFDERDLLRFADRAGFGVLHMDLQVVQEQQKPRSWERFASIAFNPRVPTLTEAIAEALTPGQAKQFMGRGPWLSRGEGQLDSPLPICGQRKAEHSIEIVSRRTLLARRTRSADVESQL